MKKYTKNLKNILWDNDIDQLKETDDIVLERFLNFWNIEDIEFMKKTIWFEIIKNYFIKNSDKIDKKSKNFWNKIFGIKSLDNNISIYEQLNTPIFKRSFR